jgi:TolB-like protein/DNA-binding winged helix-turn-helix (wHTH) protein
VAGPVYEFAGFRLDCGRFELSRDGRSIPLERKPMELLTLLVERQGELVTRAEIAQRLWSSEVFVDTEHGINTAVRKIRNLLRDRPEHPRFVQTVTGMGYRFIATVESPVPRPASYPAAAEDIAVPPPTNATPPPASAHPRLWLALGTAATLAIVTIALLHRDAAPTITSLAIIPLDNLSGDPGQDYFADGMTDELTTMLARNSTLHITSRTSAMQFKGARQSLSAIAQSLHVDGILEGSISRSGNQVHMTLQLIRADTDTHLWAESYDRSANDLAALPGEAAKDIANHLHSTVPTSVACYVNPEAHDAYLRGRYLWFRGQREEAAKNFRKAVELQPDYALGWTGLADYYGESAADGAMNPLQALPQAEALARKAVALDDQLPEAHLSLGVYILFSQWDWAHAMEEISRALELNPRLVQAIHFRARARKAYVSPVDLALIHAQLGDREQTLSLLEQGVREHSPLAAVDPSRFRLRLPE